MANEKFYPFLAFLRGPAALLVVYAHLVLEPLNRSGESWFVHDWFQRLFIVPAGIDPGRMGVALFFLISGFVIAHVAQRESLKEFLLRRLFRIYPAYWVVAAAILLLSPAAPRLTSVSDVVGVVTLANYAIHPQVIVVGVAWTLIIEMLFYLTTAAVLGLVRTRPGWATVVELMAVVLVVYSCRAFGPSWFLFSASFCQLPLLIVGQIVYFACNGRMRPATAAGLLLMAYVVYVYATYSIFRSNLPLDMSRILHEFYALGLFLLAYRYVDRLSRPSARLADLSYAIYLLHGPVGLAVLHRLHGVVPFSMALAVALVVVLALSYLLHMLVERPAMRAGRWMTINRIALPERVAEAKC